MKNECCKECDVRHIRFAYDCDRPRCECHSEARQEGGGWRERFDKAFLDTMYKDDGYSEEREVLKAFIDRELKAAEERTRRETIAEVIALVNEHDPQGAKSRITASKHYWGNTLKDELSRLQGSGSEGDSGK